MHKIRRKLLTGNALVFFSMLFICGAAAASAAGPASARPQAPKCPAQGAYETGIYRNLFAEHGLDKEQVWRTLEKAYQQFFHGNPDTESVMYPVKGNERGPMAYIKDIGNNDVRSEGMSYGMMIAVQMDKKEDFDALWNWAWTYMYHTDKKHPDYGYFAWHTRADGTKMDDNPAPDGEEYFVMALYFAAHRWGSGQGIFNYKAQADTIISDMAHRASMTGVINGKDTATINSLMNPETFMVRFTPNIPPLKKSSDHTDPSYHVPAFYELFALWGPEKDREFWQKCAQVSRDFFVMVTHPTTGLSPDYAGFDGKPLAASWDPHTVNFRSDAFRTAMNWSMDGAWWTKDLKRQEMLSDRLQAFFEHEGIDQYKANYTLDGKPTVEYRSAGLFAMNAVAGLCASHERAWKFIDAFWNTPFPVGKWRYYDGMLSMFALLNLSGNYKIYKPASSGKAAVKAGYDAWHHKAGRGEVNDPGNYISTKSGPGCFPLVAGGKAAPIMVSGVDFPGVIRVAGDLRDDINRVTGITPTVIRDSVSLAKDIVLVGTIGKSPVISRLVQEKKLDVSKVSGGWETFVTHIVEQPLPGVKRALVIAGSDQRGTIYGVYDLSAQIGVSPWYFWDDVPAKRKGSLYVLPGPHSQGAPAVKYRGFFINDENPQTGLWAPKYFGPGLAPGCPGGLNHKYWAKVFEAALRLKANYIWPAVWKRAFAEDDPENHATAALYGIVMGTSHEAPMMRGIEEWKRHLIDTAKDAKGNYIKPQKDPYGGNGEWRFSKNPEALKAYWTKGIKRMVDENFEGVVTLGMRGPGDVSLPPEDGIPLMKDILATQRKILAQETGKDLATIPQVWTLYKEVQDWWNLGLRAPEDVTVVWCDDNWGNMRQLHSLSDPERSGGYGIYYHFDYVGGGRNYKWVDANLLPNIWEQLNMVYSYGVDRLWMVNVGDMKNEEMPLQFFLDYAWNPERWPVEKLGLWEQEWAQQQFGQKNASAVAEILHTYAKLQSVRKPELLNRKISFDPTKDIVKNPDSAVIYDDHGNPFSLSNYREMENVVSAWRKLAASADFVKKAMPAEYQDAFYELVYYQVKATANVYELRLAEFRNILYAAQGRSATNDMAAIAEARLAEDKALSDYYNTKVAHGKWANWATQPHIGYGDVGRYGPDAGWQQPETNYVAIPDSIFPALKRIAVPINPDMGVAIDGSDNYWPMEKSPPVLPAFSPFQTQPQQYIEVFNRGARPFSYRIETSVPWMRVNRPSGTVDKEVRSMLQVDWSRAPKGTAKASISVTGVNGSKVTVQAVIENPSIDRKALVGFVEANGCVSIEADHYSRAIDSKPIFWKRIPEIGRTGSGMTPFPVTAARQAPVDSSPRLEYDIHLFTSGEVKIRAYVSPRNDVRNAGGLEYALSIDDAKPQIVNITRTLNCIPMNRSWERNTSDNVNLTTTVHAVGAPGRHVVKFWMVDPTVVLQKLVVDLGGAKDCYFGPPESYRAASALAR
jgi:endo-1,4-beta-D-glucanase Y